MDIISNSLTQLGGIGFGVAAVAAMAMLTDRNRDRSDMDELNLSCADALSVLSTQTSYAGGNAMGPIAMGCASSENSGAVVEALASVGISASIQSSTQICLNLAEFIRESSCAEETCAEENELYNDLVQSGLILTPGRTVGTFLALRVYYDGASIAEIARRFEAFLLRRIKIAPRVPEETKIVVAEENELVAEVFSSPAQTPAAAPVRGTKAKTTVSKTASKSRKRHVSDEDNTDGASTEELPDAISLAVSALKTPARKRRSIAVDIITEDSVSTARKSRRQTKG